MNNDKIVEEAVEELASLFEPVKLNPLRQENEAELWTCFKQIANHLDASASKLAETKPDYHQWVIAHAQAAGLRTRAVILSGAWYKSDNGALIAFDNKTQEPYALIPNKSGIYQVFNPKTGSFYALTTETINKLYPKAYSFYRAFPDKKMPLSALFFFGLQGQKVDILRLLLLQTFIGALGLFVPIATGVILDTAVPNANFSILTQLIGGILMSSLAIAAFNATQMLALIRLRFKINTNIQPAVWDRLLRLPLSFFHRFNPGDLTLRASGIDIIQQKITNVSLQAIIGGIFSFITLGLMFYYSVILTSWSIVLVFIVVLFVTVSTRILLKFQRPIMALQGKLSSLSFQFLSSIGKLHASNSESRAFAIWASQFAKKNQLFWQLSRWNIGFSILRSFFSIGLFIWLYVMVGTRIAPLSFGDFIAFNAAFSQFFTAILSMAGVITAFTELIPLYERIQPILQAIPEKEQGIDPPLEGNIKLQNIHFRYYKNSPVLENICLEINSGEMIALVGGSGCGKSTIFKLLLGFEKPEQGTIFYDNLELNRFNIRKLRKQLGVVLQTSTLLPGTIFENIVGTLPLSLEEAWEVARLACIAKDIEAMPMGMHTLLIGDGKMLSVGQRQRLMIARALAKKPRILLFDEATSALDNPTQAEIMHHIEQLNITRIVAAHRLSTITHAHRIYVIQDGRIAQTGTYKELLKKSGIFSTLVKEQKK